MLPTVPEFLQTRLRQTYGEAMTDTIIEGFSVRRPVTLRVNTLKTNCTAVQKALADAQIAYEPVPWYNDAMILPAAQEDELRSLPMYENGEIYLQGLSAMVPVLALAPLSDESILDMAAAPGGKTTQIAALTNGQAQITACERDKIRAERLRFNLERQGVRSAMVMEQDARKLDSFFSFDRILLDAPCTGSGTILLNEGEPQRRMDPAWVKKTAAAQLAMLLKALTVLRKSHEMVYSTCSILKEENEQVIRQALAKIKAEVLPIDPALTEKLPTLPTDIPGMLTIRPTNLYEGFFVCKLRKL